MSAPFGAVADRVAGALWGMFIFDALAMPGHWMYGAGEVESTFGGPIDSYRSPLMEYERTFMKCAKHGPWPSDADVVGSVINHGKLHYWTADVGYHYHCTLRAGENTLEAHLARLTMRSMTRGGFDLARLRREYEEFMRTTGSHNDAFASTYHRTFFQSRLQGYDAATAAAINKGHDDIDGLVMPVPVILGTLYMSIEDSIEASKESAGVARNSTGPLGVEGFIGDLVGMLRDTIEGKSPHDAAETAYKALQQRFEKVVDLPFEKDPIVSCNLRGSYPALLHFALKYQDFKLCSLANANAGGENVHRGLVLGAIMGAATGAADIDAEWKQGLVNGPEIEKEIQDFVQWLTQRMS